MESAILQSGGEILFHGLVYEAGDADHALRKG